jgi:TM2 domain-containing membrane protein YozV
MTSQPQETRLLYGLLVGLAGWVVPGAGHIILGERSRGAIIFIAIVALFAGGLYIGSIGVIDSVNQRPWYVGQMLTSPLVSLIAKINPSVGGVTPYQSYGRPFEIGQIYTTIAGMLNVLCIINAVYMAYSGKLQPETD